MEVIKTEREVRKVLTEIRARGLRIGLVPTMGALHEGHLSLVRAVRPHCDYVVMWIFLNPMQFNDLRDYEAYPRTLERDLELANGAGVDLVFAPSEQEIYPRGVSAYEQSECCRVYAGDCSRGFCGAYRPGHFDGVAHVVTIFFNILRPDVAVFGEKDYQQVRVIEQLVADLHLGVELIHAPIIREESGLARSSRNVLLKGDPEAPVAIWRSLAAARDMAARGETSAEKIRRFVVERIELAGLRVEYAEVVDKDSLKPLERIEDEAQLLLAAYSGSVRLIDNVSLSCQAGIS